MAGTISMKGALVAAIVAAAVLGGRPPTEPTTLAMTAFGIANVLFTPPGTAWIRATTVVAVIAALVGSRTLFPVVALLAWLIWPPAYVVGWATRRHRTANWDPPTHRTATQARVALAAVIVAVAVGALVYRALVWHRLDQTAALFVGIPTLLAITVVFAVSPKSAIGVSCKAVAIGLLVSLLFLWEGVLCIVMSAPLFFLVAVMIGLLAEQIWKPDRKPQTLFCSIALLALVPMSLEGVTDATSLSRDERITETRIVPAPMATVTRAMFDPPRFHRELPLYLRAGFPRPMLTRVEHRDAMRWIVRFRGGEMKANGMEPRAGDLVLQLTESKPGFARWQALADDSHMTHFLSWRESIVQWEPVGSDHTRVTWTIRYRRGLDPAWYFGPWERYAVRLAAGYLIDTVATP